MSNSFRIAAINLEWRVGDLEREELRELDAEITEHRCADAEEVIAAAGDADAVLSALVPFPREVLERLRSCRVICEHSVGTDGIDVAAAGELGITICNVPDYGTNDVADHALALGLALIRRVPQYGRLVAEGTWDSLAIRGIPRLQGSTWGVVGFGRIGRAVADRAAAFGMEVLAFDPALSELAQGTPGRLVSLDELLAGSEVISLHAPLTPQTRSMIGAEQLRLVTPGTILVNVARGKLVDEDALLAALDEGRLGGVALDVLGEEPPAADHPLLDHPDTLITPHAAFYSEGSLLELRRKGILNVVAVLGGREPAYEVRA